MTNLPPMDQHVRRRHSPPGRWLPVAFYVVNLALWFSTGMAAGAWDRLWLVVLPLPPLVLYLLRTRSAGRR